MSIHTTKHSTWLVSTHLDKCLKVGVTSWGIGCGTSPGVYSDLTQLEPWIQVTFLNYIFSFSLS